MSMTICVCTGEQLAVSDARSTRTETSQRIRDDEQAREERIDREVADLRQLLDRIDGLTHEARHLLRDVQHHRQGVAPEWTDRRR